MQPQSRFGDKSLVPVDTHGKMCCPHKCEGPAMTGSPNVYVNKRPALRVTDMGVHAACCGPNIWIAMKGSNAVLINKLPAHRMFDLDQHCGGMGFMIEASDNVYVGECTETSLATAQIFTQAVVSVPEQVQVIPVPIEQINVEVVPVPIEQINVEVDPVPIQGTTVEPGSINPDDDDDPGTNA
jgi:uncharacterized Zn-binding protein involved in type VI secretion